MSHRVVREGRPIGPAPVRVRDLTGVARHVVTAARRPAAALHLDVMPVRATAQLAVTAHLDETVRPDVTVRLDVTVPLNVRVPPSGTERRNVTGGLLVQGRLRVGTPRAAKALLVGRGRPTGLPLPRAAGHQPAAAGPRVPRGHRAGATIGGHRATTTQLRATTIRRSPTMSRPNSLTRWRVASCGR